MAKLKMTLDLYQIMKEEVGNGSNNLVTRETGKTIRERIEAEMEKTDDRRQTTDDRRNTKDIILLDFSNVSIIDYSCADEVIAKLVSRLLAGEYGEKIIVLTGLNPTQEENIEVALERKKIAILKTPNPELRTPNLEVIGFLTPHLKEVLDLINQNGSITAKELAETLKIELNTASTRLINLYKKHLVTRTEKVMSEGGRQFVYGVPLLIAGNIAI